MKLTFSNNLLFIISFAVSGLLGFLSTAVYSRLVSVEDFGYYSLALSIFTLMNAMLFQWNRLALLRYLDGSNDESYTLASLSSYVVLVIIAIPVFFLFYFFSKNYTFSFIMYIFFYTVSFSFIDLILAYYRASVDAVSFFILTCFKATLSLIIAALALHIFSNTVDVLILSISTSFVISTLLLFFLKRKSYYSIKNILTSTKFDFNKIKEIFYFGIPLSISLIFSSGVYSVNRLIAVKFISIDDIGIFSGYYTVTQQLFLTLAMAANAFGYSKLVRVYKENDRRKTEISLETNLGYLLSLTLTIAIFIGFNSDFVFSIYFPSEYLLFPKGYIALITVTVFMFLIKTYYLEHTYHLNGDTKRLLIFSGISFLLNLVIIIPAIEIFGLLGIILSNVGAYALNLILLLLFNNSQKISYVISWKTIKIIFSSLVTVMLLHFIGRYLSQVSFLLFSIILCSVLQVYHVLIMKLRV